MSVIPPILYAAIVAVVLAVGCTVAFHLDALQASIVAMLIGIFIGFVTPIEY